MRVILYTGKGGVGKTTVAAATAVGLARAGQRVLVMSTDGAHSLGDSLDVRLGATPTVIADRLAALEVDPATEGERAWGAIQHQLSRILRASESVAAEEMVLFPGLSELFSLLTILEVASSGDYDVVVVDCAPTGETLSLLRYPEQFTDFVTFALPAKRRMLKVIGPAAERLNLFPVPREEVFDEVEDLTARLGDLRALLTDTAVSTLRIVTVPEAVPVAEARRNFTWLHLYGFGVDAVVVNRVLPEAALEGYFASYRGRQDAALTSIAEGFGTLPKFWAELQPTEVVGTEALAGLFDQMFAGADPSAVLAQGRPYTVVRRGRGWALSLPLPDVARADLTLDQHGPDLVVAVRGHRRVLGLPDALVGKDIEGARLAEGSLTITFAG